MNRRQFIRTAGIVAATAGLAGCPGSDSGGGDSPSVIEGGQADVRTSIIHGAPEETDPFEDSVDVEVPLQDNVLVLDGLVYQPAGPRGLVISGNATNEGDRRLEAVVLTATVYTVGGADGGSRESESVEESHAGLDVGATWQWAATFSDPPDEIDFFGIDAIANYD